MNIKNTICFILLLLPFAAYNQEKVLPQTGSVKFLGEFTFDETENSFAPHITQLQQAPNPGSPIGNRKAYIDAKRQNHTYVPKQGIPRKSGSVVPIVTTQFLGNAQNGTPNDNDVAVSNNGFIVSVLNSNMRVTNESGTILKNFTLRGLGKIGVAQNFTFDPRVVYDPISDRFIIVFMNGRDQNSNTYVCFSKTNDPTLDWYAYALPGSNLFEPNTWSDYPIISISEEDLFITLNMLRNNLGFRDGFLESMIWQVSKKEGYNGDTALKYNKWNGVKWGAGNIWSICPVQGGSKPIGPKSYFLSVRPTDFQNDSLFVTEISNTLSSAQATLSTRLVKTNRKYGFPPNAPQGNGQWLSTNDGRVLTAMIENGTIQFAGNCVDTNYYTAAIFHGYFKTTSNTATLNIISSDTVDYAYPDIAYAGNGNSWDNSAMLTFSRVSKKTPSGTAVMYIDRNFIPSDIVTVRNGIGAINQLTDTLERWGDYTGIQRKYNEPKSFWLSGSLGFTTAHATIIAKISNPDPALGIENETQKQTNSLVFPNPAADWFSIDFDLPKGEEITFNVYDINGKLINTLVEDKVKAGTNKFTFNTAPLASGVYYLGVLQGNQTLKYEKIVISR